MTSYYASEVMGAGKSLVACIWVLLFTKEFPKGHIFADTHYFATSKDKAKWLKNPNDKSINFLPNFHYTPSLALPISFIQEFKDGICIVVDDIVSMDNIDQFLKILSSFSRKLDVQIIITAQYYTDIKKKVRELCKYKYKPNLRDDGTLEIKLTERINDGVYLNHYRTIDNALDFIDLYDTNEVVPPLTDSQLNDEIKKFSKSYSDLEQNLKLFYGSRKMRQDLLKEFSKDLGFNKNETTYDLSLK